MDKRVWMRWALLAATIPIAIGANAIRVALTGLLSEVNVELARGLFHEVEGYIVFVVALAPWLEHTVSFHLPRNAPRARQIKQHEQFLAI